MRATPLVMPVGYILELSLTLERFLLKREIVAFFEKEIGPQRRVEAERIYWKCLELENKARTSIESPARSMIFSTSIRDLRAILSNHFWINGQCYFMT